LFKLLATLIFLSTLAAAAYAGQLNGQVSKTDVVAPPAAEAGVVDKNPNQGQTQNQSLGQGQIQIRLQSQTSKSDMSEHSALGIYYVDPSNASGEVQVISVAPTCDLRQEMSSGDRIITIDGKSPAEMLAQNTGNIGAIVQVTFEHQGVIKTLPCQRKPLSKILP
jgi:hypothetical protein